MAENGAAWSFLVVGESQRQHRGNQGYDDQPDKYYSWDSTVPNCRGPAQSDNCLIRDSRGMLGVSQIDEVSRTAGVEKVRLRCPECESTALKGRTRMQPTYRCSHCFAEFDEPTQQPIEVTVFRADYARSWLPVDGAVTATELEKSAYLSHAKQQAIRPVDPAALKDLVASRQVLIGKGWWEGGVSIETPEIPAGVRPQNTLARIGQGEFRRRLLERFGAMCAFTGPQPVESLHAAHVTPFADQPRHDLAGGLLLRADLHSLFDRGLVTIDERLRIKIDDALRPYEELERLDGTTLRIQSDDPLLPTLRKLLEQRNGV